MDQIKGEIMVLNQRVTALEDEVRTIKKHLRAVEITVWKGVGIVTAMVWISKFIKIP